MVCCTDLIRVELAKKELNITLNAAARSVLSTFHSQVHSYGLYGYDITNNHASSLATQILNTQLHSENAVAFQFSNTLNVPQIFKHQVLEEMKLRAPMEWVKQLSNQWQTIDFGGDNTRPDELMSQTVTFEALFAKKNVAIAATRALLAELRLEWIKSREFIEVKIQQLIDSINLILQLEQSMKLLNVHHLQMPVDSLPILQKISNELEAISNQTLVDVDLWFEQTDAKLINMLTSDHTEQQDRFRSDINSTLTLQNIMFNRHCSGTQKNYNNLSASTKNKANHELIPTNIKELMSRFRESSKMFTEITGFLKSPLQSSFENILISEFALQKFNYRTYSPTQNKQLTTPENHVLLNQEVEYIINGFHTCNANDKALLAKVYVLRLALRMVEFMIRPELSGPFAANPITYILAGLSYSAGKSIIDIAHLISGKYVPLLELSVSSKQMVMLSYADYLRILLWTTPNDWKIKRIQGLIELNTGKPLKHLATGVSLQSSMQTATIVYPIRKIEDKISRSYE